MRRRYFDLCVPASSRTILTFENNVSCSNRDCSTIAFCRRLRGREYAGVQAFRVARKRGYSSNAPRNPQQFDLCVLAYSSCRDYAETQERKRRPVAGLTFHGRRNLPFSGNLAEKASCVVDKTVVSLHILNNLFLSDLLKSVSLRDTAVSSQKRQKSVLDTDNPYQVACLFIVVT